MRHCKLWIYFKITSKLHACYNSSKAKWSTYPFTYKNLQSISFNLSPKPSHAFAFDNICKLGFGVNVACLDFSLPNVKFAWTFDMASSISSTQTFSFPFILRLQRALHVGNERKMCQALCNIDDFAMFVIHTRRKQLMEIDSKRTSSKSLEYQRMHLLSRFMGLPMQQKERKFEHMDKKQEARRLF